MSKGEIQLADFISDNVENVSKLRLKNHEIDIYLPDSKLGFEFNGLYWHCELFKNKTYHYDKWKICQDNDIQLINIWEDDWQFKQDIVKSNILHKLGKSKYLIYANQCIIKCVSLNESNNFLDANHLQGKCKASIHLGLFYHDDLVYLMTFKKINLGFEMSRFCSKLNINVIDAEPILFSYFTQHYSFDKITLYSSGDLCNEDLYKTLNFKKIKFMGVNCWWSDNKHRFNKANNVAKNKIFGMGSFKYEYIN
jgi:hypothetical protein